MTNYIYTLKTPVPKEILFNLLDNITTGMQDNKYFVTNAAFKKGIYNGLIQEFYNELKTYYCPSQMIYLERKLTYNNFITVLRHVCKALELEYTRNMIYDKSTYEIVYNIHLPKSKI
jgi:hypothetical protein